ncbi:hypothetical protein J6524_09965 [Bradyrhizobium sp. WSM 1738]|uniref:hypothetical protein n=1 Tax=Bradyrhizobium hereditatis TaxID=2821405 RepID=UPI001CE26892|nr:hypothetical protein [Bradyrhizobium hereditatis]MCA6115223.1 hypothetical protein [Bradyrhizobium hereditatis]
MTVVGNPSQWIGLIDSLLPNIFQLVAASWRAMPPLAPDALEDPATEAFCKVLRQNRNASDLPFRIDTQMVELEPAAGQDQGRLDIAFSPLVNREDVYFCLECKRLNVPQNPGVRTYANEYVVFGMMRFVTGQYGAVVRHGGMLGYVLDGKVDAAIGNVLAAIVRHATDLGTTQPVRLTPSSIEPTNPHMRETPHQRGGTLGAFLIHHIFVA